MTNARVLTIPIICAILGMPMLCAGDFSNYGLQFGMNVSAAAKQAGTKPTEARLVHRRRPAVIQEMDWQPRPPVLADPVKADPVQEGLLCFFNGELYRIVVTYDRYKVEGGCFRS